MFSEKKIAKIFCFCLFAFVGLLSLPIKSYASLELIYSVNIEEQLSQSSITAVAQDSQGFIWIGTEDGLNRYDGYSVENFDKSNSNLSENFIIDLVADVNGNMWIATSNGLNLYQQSTGKFVNYFHNPLESFTVNDDYILTLDKDQDGGVWIGTYSGAAYFDPKLSVFRNYRIVSNKSNSDQINEFRTIFVGRDNKVWAGTTTGQIALFNPNRENFELQTSLQLQDADSQLDAIKSITEQSTGTLWLSDSKGRILTFNPNSKEIRKVDLVQLGIKQGGIEVLDILIDQNDTLWIATNGNGLHSYNLKSKKYEHYLDRLSKLYSKGRNIINELFLDRTGIIWLGTDAYINKLNPNIMRFRHLFAKSESLDALASDSTFALEIDQQQRLWVGSEYNGLVILDRDGDDYKKNEEVDVSLFANKRVNSIVKVGADQLWLIVDNQLWQFDASRKLFSLREAVDFEDSEIYDLIYHDSQLWIISSNGFWQLTSDNNVTHHKINPMTTDKYDEINSLVFTSDEDKVWLGTEGGLLYYDLKTGQHQRINQLLNEYPKSLEQPVLDLYRDQFGRLWIGSYGNGLIMVDLVKQEARSFILKNTTHNQTVYSIQEDANGYLWVGSGKGLYRFNMEDFSSLHFAIEEEQPISEFNSQAKLIDAKGYIYLGGINGLIYFDPNQYQEDRLHSTPVITKALINNKPIKVGAGQDYHAAKPINVADRLYFSAQDSTLEFEFASLHYSNPKKNRFRYQLDKYDEDWIEVDSSQARASYGDLSTGTYIFKVKSSNKDGLWNEQPAELEVVVLTSPFLSTLAYVIYGLIIGAVIFSFTYLFLMRLHERKKSEAQIMESEERLKLSLWGSGDELWDWEIDTGALHLSNEWQLDFPRDGIRSGFSADNSNIHPNDIAYVKQALASHLSGKSAYFESTYRISDEQGDWIWILDRGKCVEFENAKPKRMAGTLKNITELKNAEQQLDVIAKSFDNISDAVWILDEQLNFIAVNQSFERVTGYKPEMVLGKKIDTSALNNYSIGEYQQLLKLLKTQSSWQGELESVRKNGQLYPIDISINGVKNSDGEIVNYVGVFSDITFRKKAEEELRRLATTDQLTNLPNRNTFQKTVTKAINNSEQYAQHSLLFIDLDNFKRINDSLGHSIGDELLITVAEILQSIVGGSSGLVARLGGDEFTIFLENVETWNQPAKIAQSILERFAKTLVLSKNEIVVSPSIGVVMYPENGNNAEDLLRNADTAMYYAKKKGKNTYQFYTKQMNEQANMRLVMEQELRQAIEKDEFVVYYQPKVSLETGKITGLEALIRWYHPERGVVLPNEFIPLAEEAGFIIPMSRQVIEKACLQIRDWRERGLFSGKVAINLSAIQFYHENLWETVKNALHLAKIDAEAIEFEITEGMVMQDLVHSIQQMNTLNEMGITLALDDFGVGYSSLGNLKDFPISTLKIDRSFVWDLEESDRDRQLVASIVTLAHNLDIKVVAEGVESPAQALALKQMQCEEIQGFIFSKPLPPLELEKVFASSDDLLDKIMQEAEDGH